MKKNYRRLINYLLVNLLALLGFACDDSDINGGKEVCMYGTPSATYKVSVTAKDTKTGNAVEGLRVRVFLGTDSNSMVKVDSALIDVKGAANFVIYNMPYEKMKVTVSDIDGSTNGSYQDFSEDIILTNADFKDKNGWYTGTVTKSVDAKVNPK